MLSHRSVAAAGVLLLGVVARADGQRVEFDRPGYRMTSIGQRLLMTVRVTDASGRQVPNAPTVFRAADPSVASVTARGEVVSRKTGLTRIWAISGRDSGSTFVTVDPRAAKFTFSPAVLQIDALKATIQLTVQISDSAGVPITGAKSAVASCRSLNDQIVSLTETGLRARANGATYIRCADRGFADSLRVEVRQRPIRVQITSRALSKTIGDTFTVRLTARDRLGDTLVGAKPTWVSMDPKTVTVDPTSGRALAKAEGSTGLIAQLGDVADTARVDVGAPRGGGLLQAPTIVADTTTTVTTAAKRIQVRVTPLLMYEGETKPLTYSVTDTAGLTLTDAKVTLRTNDPSVAIPTDSGLKAGKVGEVWATVRYQGSVDSAIVTVRDSTKRAEDTERAADIVNVAIVEPTYPSGLAEKYEKERAALMDSIHRSGAFAPASGKTWNAGIYAGLAAHSSNQENSTTSKLIEDRSGVVYGGRTTLRPFGWMALSGDFRLGKLNSPGAIGESLNITEAVGDISFYIMPWLGLGGGYAIKSEKTQIANQRWTIPHASITARTSFVGDFISTTTTFSVLPGATFTGMPEDQQPDMGVAGEAGLEIRRGSLDAGLTYYVERLPFPELLGRSRVDQFSSLRLRVGFKVGR